MIDDEQQKDDDQDDDLRGDDFLGDEDLRDDFPDGSFDDGDDDSNEYLVEAMMNDLGPVSLCYFHFFFSTSGQRPLFEDEELRSNVQHELARVCKRLCCPEQGISVGSDHAHVLCRVHPELSIDDLLKRLKGDSQAWILGQRPELGPVIWQAEYGGCSVGGSEIGEVRRYLEEEPQRHKLESYEDEFRRLCAENGIEIVDPDCWE